MIANDRLASVALGDADEAEVSAVEEHVLACSACARTFEQMVRIGHAVRELVPTGAFAFPMTSSLIARMRELGLVSRTYEVANGEVVPCTVGAADIYALTTLSASFEGVTRASLVVSSSVFEERMDDVPFDAAAGRVSYVTRSSILRRFPSTRVTLSLYANEPTERLLGRYTLEHTAFAGR